MPRKTTEVAATTKSPAKKRTVTRRKKTEVTEAEAVVLSWERVATRAYYIHLEEGGNAHENWLRAEQELLAAA